MTSKTTTYKADARRLRSTPKGKAVPRELAWTGEPETFGLAPEAIPLPATAAPARPHERPITGRHSY